MTKFWSNFGQFLVKFWPGKTMKTQGGVPRILELVESWVLGIAVRNDQIFIKFWSMFGQILAGQNYENTRRGTSNFGICRILGFGNCPWAVCRGFGTFCLTPPLSPLSTFLPVPAAALFRRPFL